jgi:hypothetical protein
MSRIQRCTVLGAALATSLALTSCGGGGTNYDGSILSGTVLMGYNNPVVAVTATGATSPTPNVCFFAAQNGWSTANPVNTTTSPPTSTGTQLTSSCVATDANGHFSVDLTNSAYGPVVIQVTGGTYDNGTALVPPNLQSTNASLQAIAQSAGGGTVSFVVTPLTTIATMLTYKAGISAANYATASTQVAHFFTPTASAQTIVPVGNINVAPTSATDPYNLALLGVQTYLAAGLSSDATGSQLLSWNLSGDTTMASDYTAAFNQANTGYNATFSFN